MRLKRERWIGLLLGGLLVFASGAVGFAQESAPSATVVAAAEVGYAGLLRERVTPGFVDYAALAGDARLDAYLAELAERSPAERPTRAEQLAGWINAFNACTLKLVAEHYPIASINELANGGRHAESLVGRTPWDIRVCMIGQRRFTLREIEQRCLAPEFGDGRVRFALATATKSGPALRAEPYVAEKLDAQLEEQARLFVRQRCEFQLARKRARLSALFEWHAREWGSEPAQRLGFLARYVGSTAVAESLRIEPEAWTTETLHFDWSLNDVPRPGR